MADDMDKNQKQGGQPGQQNPGQQSDKTGQQSGQSGQQSGQSGQQQQKKGGQGENEQDDQNRGGQRRAS